MLNINHNYFEKLKGGQVRSVTQSGSELSIIAQTGESIEQIEIFTITGASVYSAIESTNVHTVNLNLSKAIYLIRVKTSIETQNLKFNWK
ncbi:MAG: T9SS type A sorting domain-containing protein [Silvanigrellaceae bacterium]|nr:T9SS type A sorting domain-containing protein [Silvanigrellaceae bacterium]